MAMDLTLSVYFSSDRIYMAVVEPTNKGLSLAYVGSTALPYDLDNPENKSSLEVKSELENMLYEIGDIVNAINITLPSDVVLVSKFPGNSNIPSEEVKQLLNLEIRQSFPQFTAENFSTSVYALAPKLDGSEMLMAIIIPKDIFKVAKKLVGVLNAPVNKVETSQLNAQTAFLYSYPEYMDKTVALFGLQNQFVDVSVLKNGKPVYYNLASLPDPAKIGSLCETEFDKIMSDYAEFIDSAFFFGSGLNKEILQTAEDAIAGMVMSSGKLNAFRMMRTDVDQRHREYCSRVSHIFPPCIGGCLPDYNKKLKLI